MDDLILDPAHGHSADKAGGKGAALARLVAAGFDVPPFFVIRPEGFAWSGGSPRAARGLKAAIAAALPAIGPGPFAVRSSGGAEDGAEHSHAGQYATYLNIPPGGVTGAAAKVWASGFSDTVAAYTALKDGGAAKPPAIVVQRMVPARAAGVAFSADPVSGLRGRCVVSAVSGLGEALVSGEVDGETWVIDAADRFLTEPEEPRVLDVAEAQRVAVLARQAEDAFGCPQDIEWAFDGNRLVILQSRPITTPLRPVRNEDNHLSVFDNSNIIESYPGIVSPLTYSFAREVYGRVYRAFVRLLGVRKAEIAVNAAVFDNMLARLDGRIYYNLGNWYRALALLPGFSRNRAHMEVMMGVDDPLPEELSGGIGPPPSKGLARLSELSRMARVGAGLLWQAIRLPRTRRGFYARLNDALAGGPACDRAGLTDLAGEYRRIETLLLDRWDAPLVNDFLCMMAFGASRKVLSRWAGEAGEEFHNAFMIGQGDIVSAEPARRIAEMGAMVASAGLTGAFTEKGRAALREHPAIDAEFAAYIERFGDRCTQELKLESIPLSEDDTALVAAVAAAAARGMTGHDPVPDPDWSRLMPGRPVRRGIARALTTYAKARVRDRENLRFERTRIFGHARRVFLAIGRELSAMGVLDAPRDVFLLSVEEVLGAIEGAGMSQNLRGLVDLRRAEMEAAESRPDPAERIIVRGGAIATAITQTETSSAPDGDEMAGTGCSAGRVTGKARVILDPRRQSLEPGEILVARNTDPGWIAVFANAAAIVVERGSLLSHSAIVARELGIPCVVGIRRATDWIVDGDMLDVDGKTGQVRRIHG